MTIHVALRHQTRYQYDRLIALAPHVIRLKPAPHCRTPIAAYSLKVTPAPHFVNWQQDPFGNYLGRFVFPERTREFSFDVELIADMTVINPFDFFLEEAFEQFPFAYDAQTKQDLAPYLERREDGPLLREWLTRVNRTPQTTVSFLVELNARLQQDIQYLVRMEPGVQTCEETLGRRAGSCRDSGWLLVQILRQLGLAARFVSGYLIQLAPDIKPLDGPAGPAQDFTDLHAWAEVYLPGAGWLGLDPTSGLFAGEGHIPLACTPTPGSAAPVTGAHEPCEVEFTFANTIERIHEDPRVTQPYTETQWAAVMTLGHDVDQELITHDVRLTMGGEPTFIARDDMESPEWSTAALGERKRELAGELVLRLRDRVAPEGLLHQGQGKWYPGEPLPRWALSVFWRTDGQALWRNPRLLATDSTVGVYGAEHASRLIRQLAAGIGLAPSHIVPGYEDVHHYLQREGELPLNVDPFDAKLEDPLERERLRQVFSAGLKREVGYVLPLKHKAGQGWSSSPWSFRRGRLYLLPGNSPMGLRLPLASLPWRAPKAVEPATQRDPFASRLPLPPAGTTAKPAPAPAPEAPPAADAEIIHTALCVESRDGIVHVFMPPLTELEAYVELLHVVEASAERLHLPIVIEGYEPPKDPRLQVLQVTPDPGVIEVNIHPAQSWQQLVDTTAALYEDAHQCRLGTEKFMLDGRHTGTGGGNHVTLGGASAAASPFLRRPQLLRSLLTYWQNHPSLSYLFSGQFIGPTSQAPRVDEARDDNLYELEIALRLLPVGDSPQPWLVDRILRNFLVDLTGNTHRSEFCIDKLYSPDSPVGRRGLVEFRAFEMPPHARMSLVQMLLLRALVARFWQRPYTRPLVRWGTELHDRFMLPHFVWEDFKLVIEDLRSDGYPFDLAWFEPFREFRFPHIGRMQVRDLQLELTSAIEPWHVLGEEAAAGGVARYVDSSVERLQVRLRGGRPHRYVVTCNQRRVPLCATGRRGEFVAGVRYKAWQPYSSLHPTIAAHAPLVFDIVDTLNNRSLGGCAYHVAHPGGRNYDTFPVNANAAEARRIARFSAEGHTPGKLAIVGEDAHPDHPYTLDLRYPLAQR